jgi:hypothetical protein
MIFFECYADESLLRVIGMDGKSLRGGHSFGRSNVSRKLRKWPNSLALIDEDPNAAKDSFLKDLYSLVAIYSDDYIQVLFHKAGNSKVIVLRPDLEGFAIRLAKDKGIDLKEKYKLSMNKSELHDLLRIEKNSTARKKFAEFIKEVSDHKAILKIKEFSN